MGNGSVSIPLSLRSWITEAITKPNTNIDSTLFTSICKTIPTLQCSKEMVMDFKILRENNTVHILNAISPAFSSSMAFAGFIAEEYLE